MIFPYVYLQKSSLDNEKLIYRTQINKAYKTELDLRESEIPHHEIFYVYLQYAVLKYSEVNV